MKLLMKLVLAGVLLSGGSVFPFYRLVRAAAEGSDLPADVDVNITTEDDEPVAALFYLTMNNRLEGVRRLIDAGANVNWRSQRGRTALMYALQNHAMINPELIDLLIEHSDFNIFDFNGGSALHYAAVNYPEAIPAIIARGADVNLQDADGMTPLLRALQASAPIAIVRALMQAPGANNTAHDVRNRTALHYAVLATGYPLEGRLALIRDLINAGVDINQQDVEIGHGGRYGDTALSLTLDAPGYADDDDRLAVVHELLEHGARVDLMRTFNHRLFPFLLFAVRHGDPRIVAELIAHGAQVDREASARYLSEAPNAAVAQVLVDQGHADVNMYGGDRLTPLMNALSADEPHLDVILFLIERSNNLDMLSTNAEGAAIHLVRHLRNEADRERVLRAMLEHHADINVAFNGVTALMKAAVAGDVGMARLLLAHGANIDLQDINGRTALIHAARTRHHSVDMIDLLLDNHANQALRDSGGRTAFENIELPRDADAHERHIVEQMRGLLAPTAPIRPDAESTVHGRVTRRLVMPDTPPAEPQVVAPAPAVRPVVGTTGMVVPASTPAVVGVIALPIPEGQAPRYLDLEAQDVTNLAPFGELIAEAGPGGLQIIEAHRSGRFYDYVTRQDIEELAANPGWSRTLGGFAVLSPYSREPYLDYTAYNIVRNADGSTTVQRLADAHVRGLSLVVDPLVVATTRSAAGLIPAPVPVAPTPVPPAPIVPAPVVTPTIPITTVVPSTPAPVVPVVPTVSAIGATVVRPAPVVRAKVAKPVTLAGVKRDFDAQVKKVKKLEAVFKKEQASLKKLSADLKRLTTTKNTQQKALKRKGIKPAQKKTAQTQLNRTLKQIDQLKKKQTTLTLSIKRKKAELAANMVLRNKLDKQKRALEKAAKAAAAAKKTVVKKVAPKKAVAKKGTKKR